MSASINISAKILNNHFRMGLPIRDAFDSVLGKGAYDRIAEDIWEAHNPVTIDDIIHGDEVSETPHLDAAVAKLRR